MADMKDQINDANELAKKLEEVGKAGAEASGIFNDIGKDLQKMVQTSGDFQGNIKLAKQSQTNLARDAKVLAGVTKTDLKDKKLANDLSKKAQNLAKNLTSVQNQRAVIADLLVNATEEEAETLRRTDSFLARSQESAQGIVEGFEELNNENDKLNKNTKFFDNISGLLTSIPVIGKLFGEPFEKASQDIRDLQADGAGFFEQLNAGAAAFDRILLTGVVTSLFKADSSTTNLAKQLAISKDSAQDLKASFNAIAIDSGTSALNADNLVQSFIELGDSVGAVSGFNAEQIEQQGRLTNLVGLQAGEAAKLSEFGILNGETTRSQTTDILEQVKLLEQETGIRLDGRKILAEVANVNGQLGAQYSYNTQEIARAVVQANRLGLSLEETQGIASNLLDFEQSITNELEAELLLGRNLNLEQARLLALQGDSAGAAAEMAKQFGTAEEFSKLNVIQQQSLAKAVGMGADELADSIRKQQVLSSLGAESIAQLEKQGRLDELRGDANGEILLKQYEQQSAADSFTNAMTKLQSALGSILEGPLGKLIDGFSAMADSSAFLYSMMGAIGAVSLIRTIGSVVSLAASLGTAGVAGAGLASALTLGVGAVAIAAGIGVIAAAMMSAQDQVKTMDDGIIPAGYGDRIISTPKGQIALNNQDTLVAGTNLGGNSNNEETKRTNMLLEKLITQNDSKPQLSPVGLYEVQ